MGFTHVELLPITEHPVRRLLGLSGRPAYFAPTAASARPEDFAPLRRSPATSAGIGVILDWVPGAFPDGCARRSRASTARALYEHADPRRGLAPGLEHRDLQLRPPRGAQLPDRQRALLARGFHVDGLRVDAVASMLYLDYSRGAGRMDPQPLRRTREPRGDRLPAAAQRRATTSVDPGVADDRRGIHRLARCHPADLPRRPRLRLQMEHGLDARHAAYMASKTRCTAATTTTS